MKRRTAYAAMKKSKLVPLLFVGAILLPGCGGPAPRNTTGINPPAIPATPNSPAPYFITCKNCKTINEVAEGGSVCRQCGKPLDMPPAPVTSSPQKSSGVTSSPRSHTSSGPIFVPSGGSSYGGSRPSTNSSPTGPRTYSSGSSTRTPVAPSHSSGGSSYSSSKPSSSSSSSSTVRGGFGSSSRSSIS